MTKLLGKLEKVELREIWINESTEFTPWLAQEENLSLLGETINIELEFEAKEKEVGPFRADILCKNTLDNSWVLIENQLAKTDHTHLGQLLTYAAGLEAVTIVWIAENFTEEHRAALDWLNEVTEEQINFFGLEIELWKIGDSPTAPKFNIISKPNDWSKTVSDVSKRIGSGELSETKQLQLEYWSTFRELLLKNKSHVKTQKPLPQHWTNIAIGRSFFWMFAYVNSRDERIGLGLAMAGPHSKAYYKLLFSQKEEIESEMGEVLDWRELPDKKESHIELHLRDTNPTDKDDWPRQHKWLQEKVELFYKVFSLRVKKLDVENNKTEDVTV